MEGDTSGKLPKHIEETLRLIGRKWAIPVLHELTHSPLTFGELKNKIPGISASVLSGLLSDFQVHGVLEKKTVNPPHHTYFIGDFGMVFCDIIERIDEFGKQLLEIYPAVKSTNISEAHFD